MAYSPIPLGQDPKYERFLFAPVGEDGRGASVSVLSMLARLNVDPWREASDLTAMPEGSARQRLDALLARFTDVPGLIAARSEVVSRLLAFLPRGAFSGMPGDGDQSAKAAPSMFGIPLHVIIAIALLLAYLGIQALGQ